MMKKIVIVFLLAMFSLLHSLEKKKENYMNDYLLQQFNKYGKKNYKRYSGLCLQAANYAHPKITENSELYLAGSRSTYKNYQMLFIFENGDYGKCSIEDIEEVGVSLEFKITDSKFSSLVHEYYDIQGNKVELSVSKSTKVRSKVLKEDFKDIKK